MKYCKYCGSKIEKDSKFCPNCGASVEEINEYYNEYNDVDISKNHNIGQRNIVVAVILSIVTCGIYGIYWMIKINDELLEITNQEGTSGIMVVLLTIVTCGIYGIYWCYKMGKCVDIAKNSNDNMPLIFLLLFVCGFSIVNYVIAQDTINKYAK